MEPVDVKRRKLRILVLEDSPADAELLERALSKGHFDYDLRCVQTREEFVKELETFEPHVILADYALPSFDGLTALEIVRRRSTELPYIFVSGSIGEERAVEALKRGATDYLLKGNLTRLVPAILRAIAESDERAHRRRLEEQFRQAQKMEAVGQLAGGIAHDFNNLLTAIMGYTELVLSQIGKSHALVGDLGEIRRAGERAADLTRQLLAFSRKQMIQPRVLDLNVVVGAMSKLLRRVIGEDIELVTKLAPDPGRVKADPGQIEQVIMNLAVNARDAMPDGGTLTIETGGVVLDGDEVLRHLDLRPGPHVMLSVGDTGCGMDERVKARLFEPFFTTKGPGKGTGLGLATVYGIVKQSGGDISVYSEVGHGTSFKIYLPRIEAPADVLERGTLSPIVGGAETVVVAEDEVLVRTLTCRALKMHGYTVLEAADGEDAVRIVETHKGPISLVITDVVMPKLGGKELMDRVAALRPELRFLFVSGYTSATVAGREGFASGLAFLQKPFTPDALARKVREVLDAPAKA